MFLFFFWLFFFFFSFFALTFHKCQIVMKAILSFFDFWTIFWLFFSFSFHFFFDLPQVSNCYADWGLITAAGEAYDSGRGLITGAGKAYDSGRGAFLCAFRFFLFYESDSFIF